MNSLRFILCFFIVLPCFAAQDDPYAWLFDESIQSPSQSLVKKEESLRKESEAPGFFSQFFAKVPMPNAVRALLAGSSLDVTESFVPGPAGFSSSIAFAGMLTISNTVIEARVVIVTLANGADGYALMFSVPDTWKLSQVMTDTTPIDGLLLDNPALVIATFDYDDAARGVRIQKGVNLLSRAEWAAVQKPSVIDQFAQVLQKNITHVILHVHLLPSYNFFSITVPSSAFVRQEMALASIIKPSSVMPPSVVTFIKTGTIKAPLLRFTLGSPVNACDISGQVQFAGTRAAIDVHVQAVGVKQADAWLRLQLPDGWNAAQALSLPVAMTLQKPTLIISTMPFDDALTGKKIIPGVSMYAQVHTDDLPVGAVTQSVSSALAQLFPYLDVSAIIAANPAATSFVLRTRASEQRTALRIADLVNLDATMNRDVHTLLSTMTIERPAVELTLKAQAQKLEVSGGATVDGYNTQVTLFMHATKKNSVAWHIILRMPPEWKASDTLPGLSFIGELSLERPVLIFSTHEYKDTEFKRTIKKGVTLLSGVDLSGPLQAFHDFLAAISSKSVIVEDKGPIQLVGTIEKNVGVSAFSITVPTNVGIDFNLLYKQGRISEPPSGIAKIMLDGFSLSLTPTGSKDITSGMIVSLTTQKDPLRLRATVSTSPKKAHIETALEGTIEHFIAPWFSLGDVGIEVDCDYAVMETTGLPSGIGIRGTMALSDARLNLAGKAAVSARGVESFVFVGKAEELNITQLVAFLSRIIGKPVAIGDLPHLNFEQVHVTVVPKKTTIAQKVYQEGLSGAARINILGATAAVSVAVTANGIASSGRIDTIDTPVIRLTGPGPDGIYGTADDGPYFNLMLDAGVLSSATVHGTLEIPALKIKQESDIRLTALGGHAVVSTQLFGLFAADIELRCALDSLADAFIRGTLQQSALKSFEESVEQLAQTIATQAEQEMEATEKEARAAILRTQKKLNADIVVQINKALKRIDTLQAAIKSKKKKCKKASMINKTIVCPKIGIELVPLAGELAAQELYLEGLLRPGKKASRAVLQAGSTLASTGIKMTTATANAVADMVTAIGWLGGQAINIESLTFECRVADIAGAKLPKVTIKGTFFGRELTLKDMQLDLTNPVDSLEVITLELMKVIR